jgi:hypothetical protein
MEMEQAVRTVGEGVDTDLRAEAVRRLKGRREFRAHLFAYVLVNLALWGIWGVMFATAGVWFPWPVFVTFGWGIGVAFHAWDVYGRRPITEDEIQREGTRLRQSRLGAIESRATNVNLDQT